MKPRMRITCWSALRARSSLKLCEERLACKGNKPLSIFYCEDCRSHQCDLCEALLHEDIRISSHARHLVSDAPEELLCDAGCKEKNYADVTCESCDSKFCYPCDHRVHSRESKKTHTRKKFSCENTEEFLSCEGDTQPLGENPTMFSLSSAPEDLPDLFPAAELRMRKDASSNVNSFLLIDDKEQLQVKDVDEFIQRLQCDRQKGLKVVSIFGNTGDGKSYTLNHTFYNGHEMFKTSDAQSSCTIGVWAAYCPSLDLITIDTEGFLGQASNPNSRARMLLKVLAISDIIIYRTRAERLHNDMFSFLGDASVAYAKHFAQELEELSSRCNIEGPVCLLGPAVVIFHETHHTNALEDGAEIQLRKRFHELGLKLDSFSSLEYIGVKTDTLPTDFSQLKQSIERNAKNYAVRTARSPSVTYKVLKVLNDKFSGNLDSATPNTFPDQYFTCQMHCLSCKCRCTNSMNHINDNIPHSSSSDCILQCQYENRSYLCKVCYERGKKIVVCPKTVESNEPAWLGLAKYAWTGYILECSICGVIYRSRQYWYGNKDPWETCVRIETCHMWPDESDSSQLNRHTAQYILDNITSVSEIVSHISARPSKMLSSWMADQIAPSYWVPNSQITKCGLCPKEFGDLDSKHHCRMCGGGFCESCSSNKLPVPGWGTLPVRVCNSCYEKDKEENEVTTDPSELTARKVGEIIHSALGTVASAVNYPIGIIKDTARPPYWVPDHLITKCYLCEEPFSPKLRLHHCRACGRGVCDECSPGSQTVPERGWTHKVRVCKTCLKGESS